ncbi:hypothetical protein H5J22_02605 [Cetobacterium sp. 8H]|uniref:phage baseplate protein n=1 Tax=Cetobacterium sp. 8H TaxID=2759681 RepID=UPI00163BB070|nr:pyocin knob domain-containing protein [Cetobacterium sp. 8H]MBC2850334.1 hypothetical protein [Cetobacterium sp. 8H]
MPKDEKQIKEITDNDLDTGKDLVTENYELEILTLKDKVDLRRFSRSFLRVDKLLKSIFTGKEDKFSKNSGFNKVKTDLAENDTNKVFSAKGAFDLKTYLVTNYTTLMNNIRDNLTNSINTKLSHGGYDGTGQQLKNDIDVINNNRFKIKAKPIGNTLTNTDLNTIVDNGFYVSISSGNLITNTPTSETAFELTVTGATDGRVGYKTQLFKSLGGNSYYVRTNTHWSEHSWTTWRKLVTDDALKKVSDESFKRCKFLQNGLPTIESILYLEPGIYNVAAKPIFGIGSNYYTVQRLNGAVETGDNVVIVYEAGSGSKFWITSFNSNNWTGWKEFNHCPYKIGDFYLTGNVKNPALVWHGTSWELIEGRMLIGAKSGQFNLGTTGGNQNIKLTREQLPRHRFQVDSFSLGRGTMNIIGSLGTPTKEGAVEGTGAFAVKTNTSSGRSAGSGGGGVAWSFDASRAWTGTTTAASPYTNYIGNDDAINIMNPYLAINIWKRIG